MTKVIAVFTIAVFALAFVLPGLAAADVAQGAEDFTALPGKAITAVGDFLHSVATTPVGEPRSYHDFTGSKPSVKMMWEAPRPTLSQEHMR